MASRFPSLSSVAKFALGSAQIAMLQPYLGVQGGPASCPNPQLSCQASGPVDNTCCYNSPGGEILQTQFWDAQPATGPSDSWTIHGLWPDNCDGSYEQYCDRSRQYKDIGGIIQAAGATDLLDYMNTYWKDVNGDDESFWQHEWGKHGTCISTLDTNCYTNYVPHQELVDFVNATVVLFQQLNTYQALATAGITPSTSKAYQYADIEAALAGVTGHQVTLGCKSGELNEVWYHFNVLGSVQTGTFVASDPLKSKSTCPRSGIRYLPKA